MPILQQVQKVYDNLLMPYRYEVSFLKNGKVETLKFQFKADNLKHLLGIHKIKPYNNKIRYPGQLIYNKIKNKTLLFSHLHSKPACKDITTRIIHLLELDYLFNDSITKNIYEFDKNIYQGSTNIKSKYIIYNDKISFSLNLGLARNPHKSYIYPETWFIRDRDKDKYIKGQNKYDIISIKKTKI